jgi:D-alanyl-D-alanine carboxypeptidase/D-alanyl-D-alanine-endopeptidase (penicillin-binding protein 4)
MNNFFNLLKIFTIKSFFKSKELLIIHCALIILFSSCSVSKQIARQADAILIKDTAISQGHIGISIYEPATGKYWYNYDATKYFVPASNTKLFTLYAGMKYLGDSLTGIRYFMQGDTVNIFPNADPTLLHPDFRTQPVYDWLTTKKYFNYYSQFFSDKLGKGWAWDDYNDDYMVQRSELPVYGNLITITKTRTGFTTIPKRIILDIDRGINNEKDSFGFSTYRDWKENKVYILPDYTKTSKKIIVKKVPFAANPDEVPQFLMDTLHSNFRFTQNGGFKNNDPRLSLIHSQPSDSLFKPMMHRSDNFFAEQTLLMVSNERLGYMNDEAIIDTLLSTDLKDLPQKPKWVDGSGLSRYNLFTPQSFIYILSKLSKEFGWNRIKNILPTGGEGTLKSWYINDSGFIYAKTGTLSNHCALSGFLITNKGKSLIFSILVNHYQTGATPIRKAVEHFLETIRSEY